MQRLARDEQHHRGAGQRDRGRLEVQRLVDEEDEDREDEDRHGAARLGGVLDRAGARRAPSRARAPRARSAAASGTRGRGPGITTASATITIGARLAMKAPNDRPVWPAIRMFGGSPISVAVPPMFDATISMMISGTGSTSSASASRNVIGTISRIVVTLSRNADSTAVVTASASTTAQRPPARELAGADRQPRVDAGGLGHADHDHHPDQQADRVEVDRLDRLLLVERAAPARPASRRAARSWCGRRARRRSARARRRRRRRRRPRVHLSGSTTSRRPRAALLMEKIHADDEAASRDVVDHASNQNNEAAVPNSTGARWTSPRCRAARAGGAARW